MTQVAAHNVSAYWVGQIIAIPDDPAYGDAAGTTGMLTGPPRPVAEAPVFGHIATVMAADGQTHDVWVCSCWGCGTPYGPRWAAQEGVEVPHTYCLDCAPRYGQPMRAYRPLYADGVHPTAQPIPA
jgi:hypothetical protein